MTSSGEPELRALQMLLKPAASNFVVDVKTAGAAVSAITIFGEAERESVCE
tara:strand:- start:231 stop:383 length:153 start_codon:yes stop_codon:yes gene_type:complete